MSQNAAERPIADTHERRDGRSGFRWLYARVADPEAPAGAEFAGTLRAGLRQLDAPRADQPGLGQLQREAAAWSRDESLRYRGLLTQSGAGGQDVMVRRAALSCAPLALRSGGWLQWLSGPGNADDPVALRILAIYASDVGVGHPAAARGSAYLALLRELLLSEHAIPAERLALNERIADDAFYLPAVLLAMSRQPERFLPEILGADLCLRSVGLLPVLAAVQEVLPAAANWTAIDPGAPRAQGQPADVLRCRDAVEALLARTGDGSESRVREGFTWALEALRRWSEELHAELRACRDPAFEMAELLRLRARDATTYHQDYQLQGQPLSQWLRECRTDPAGLMRALAASRLVKPGHPEASPLTSGLLGERGPMFRVFAPGELAVIRRWIDSLPAPQQAVPASQQAVPARPPVPARPAPLLPRCDTGPAGRDPGPGTLRAAYHQLLRRTDAPGLRRFAHDYVRTWLRRSGYKVDRAEFMLAERWGPEGLRPWLSEQHDRHGREFQANSGTPLPSRQALIDATVQLAPLTLVDGAWLQGFTDYERASSEVGHFLFQTYWDELGNGEPRLNHPLIYREVLAEMGVELPPTASPEFAQWPGFRNESFELPVYWLSIGRFPRTFMPEVLGLNLAMELSGVGGSYRRSRIALRAYGFSTRFVDIHNTIDNVASGHSAWAADAIDIYMASVAASLGAKAQAETWERIRVGYRSLCPPTGFRARRAGRRPVNSGSPR